MWWILSSSLTLLLLSIVLLKSVKAYKEKNQWNKFIIPIAICFFLIFSVLIASYLLTGSNIGYVGGFNEIGKVRDTVGGLINPIIAIAGVIVTGFAFYAQYNANQQLKESSEVQLFDTQFYNMIELYKTSVSQLKIDKETNGKECFEHWLNEVKVLCIIADATFENQDSTIDSQLKRMEIVMHYFFYGKGKHRLSLIKASDLISIESLNFVYPERLELYKKTVNDLKAIPSNIDTVRKKWDIPNSYFTKSEKEVIRMFEDIGIITLREPFFSKSNQLSSYFRILNLIIYFVIDSTLISQSQKKIYIKIFRSLLTPYEQLFIYFNCFITSGENWIDKGAIVDYKIIKNMPVELIDFGLKPFEYFMYLKERKLPDLHVAENDGIKEVCDDEGKAIFDFYS